MHQIRRIEITRSYISTLPTCMHTYIQASNRASQSATDSVSRARNITAAAAAWTSAGASGAQTGEQLSRRRKAYGESGTDRQAAPGSSSEWEGRSSSSSTLGGTCEDQAGV
eukprot:GHVU01206140.1.p2 GENE.GHVU01206140.1~~GHVU01206140.1.p2  ORF type:complete len:111 (-),score=16.17 GHVU01206140.1:301-633(-)